MSKFACGSRTHHCGVLGKQDLDKEVVVMGWAHSVRDHGGLLFIDLRDHTGLLQLVCSPDTSGEAFKVAEKVRSEYVLAARGVVSARSPETVNPKIATGEIEVRVQQLEILNTALTPPFEIEDDVQVDENTRLKYRYIDLRRPKMQRNLRLRHKFIASVREFLNKEDFVEVETPLLLKRTPEGARDFLVPSRTNPGKFYALPQSPQLMKQVLMASGIDRYYQLARCLRDEDLRADRQYEHTQIDIEMAFVDQEDVLQLTERLMAYAFKQTIGVELELPFPRLSYAEAMERFGSDKPDMRFGCELVDLSDVAAGCNFKVFRGTVESGGQVKGLRGVGCASYSRKELDDLIAFAQRLGAKGLAYIVLTEEGVKSPIAKFFTEDELEQIQQRLEGKPGDVLFFVADKPAIVAQVLGRLRLELAERQGLIPEGVYKPLFVVDFPLFEYNEEEGRLQAMHHPFTMPQPQDMELLETEPLKVKGSLYDLVMNGVELASGSIRIHNRALQEKVFELIGLDKAEAARRFGFLLDAFEHGAPPHGGIAPGVDRIVALMLGEDSIREVIAFPKTQKGLCPLTGAPSEVEPVLLDELNIEVIKPLGDEEA